MASTISKSWSLLTLGTAVVCFASVGSAAVAAAVELEAVVGKRSLIAGRQTCSIAGWIPACPGPFSCVPPGAICCSDGISYAMPPEVCPDGTQPIATATTGGPPPVITTPPPPPPPVVSFTWYTYTITWYYWYYYYIYIDITSTQLVSMEKTSFTTISYSATDAAAASSYFESFTATAVFPTPTQTNTPVSGAPPPPSSTPPSYPTSTPSETTTYAPSSAVIPSYSAPFDNATVTTASPSSATTSPVTAGAARIGLGGGEGSWVPMIGAAFLGLLSGVAMIAL
ncbi:hypothetical protein V8F33_005567 [Rhypophila sp. PSN 637]